MVTPGSRRGLGAGSMGLTILELVVATALTTIVLASLVSVVATQSRLYSRTAERTRSNQTLRLIVDVLSRDVRRAGFDPAGTALVPVLEAGPTRLLLQADDDGDGSIDRGSRERVGYLFRPGAGTLSRIVGRQSMPLAEDLPPDGFHLSYRNDAGETLDPHALSRSPHQRAAIRRIDVVLIAGGERQPPASLRTSVAVRNRPWSP